MLVVVVLLLSIAPSCYGESKADIEVQMAADLATYDSCVSSVARKMLASDANTNEIVEAADTNCGVYHEYYMARAQRFLYFAMPVESEPELEAIREETRAIVLREFRATSDSIRDLTKRRLVRAVESARSSQ